MSDDDVDDMRIEVGVLRLGWTRRKASSATKRVAMKNKCAFMLDSLEGCVCL
jgi:hypothetical protein